MDVCRRHCGGCTVVRKDHFEANHVELATPPVRIRHQSRLRVRGHILQSSTDEHEHAHGCVSERKMCTRHHFQTGDVARVDVGAERGHGSPNLEAILFFNVHSCLGRCHGDPTRSDTGRRRRTRRPTNAHSVLLRSTQHLESRRREIIESWRKVLRFVRRHLLDLPA